MKRRELGFAIAVAILLLWSLVPIYWFVRMAFLTHAEIARFPPAIVPAHLNIGAFFNIFGSDYHLGNGAVMRASGQSGQIINGLQNSIIVSVVVTLITIVIVVPLAYVFARLEFKFKNLLLNAVLTVQMGAAASHQGRGWERFTDAVIRLVNAKPEPVVFLLWGSHAQK